MTEENKAGDELQLILVFEWKTTMPKHSVFSILKLAFGDVH